MGAFLLVLLVLILIWGKGKAGERFLVLTVAVDCRTVFFVWMGYGS